VSFTYQRVVRFQDTDAAGVVYFANGLSLCHEAYEASLAASGMNLKQFFGGGSGKDHGSLAFPITHASIDFFQPLFCGDRLDIHLSPAQTSSSSFTLTYQIFRLDSPEKPASQAQTRHVCIERLTRSRHSLPPDIIHWLARWGNPGATTLAPAPD
jgi:1,4-dihydroxy-2-naphthoyl-CoA hydrolase